MEGHAFSLEDAIDILKYRKAAYLLPFLFISIISVCVALLLPPVYKSKATLLIEKREIPAQYVTSSITTFAEERMQSIHARILTSTRLLELIDEFELYSDLKEKKTKDEIIENMKEDIKLVPVNVEIADRMSGRTATATIAFNLSYEGENPEKVQKVANTITSLFLEEDLKVRKEQSSSAYDFLFAESEKVKNQISELEKKMALFKKENLKSLPELFQLNQQTLGRIDRDTEYTKETLRNLKEKKEELQEQLDNTPVFIEDTELQKEQKYQDQRRLEALKIELINLKTEFSDLYPDVIKTKQEIKDLALKVEESRKEEKDKQKNPAWVTLSSRLAGTKSDIASTNKKIEEMEKHADDIRLLLAMTPGVEEKYNAFVAERNNLYMKHSDLQAKMMEAKVARELESEQKGERFSLVEPARLPEKPFKPNRVAIVLIGIVLGSGAGVGLAALIEFSDSSFSKGDALSKSIGFPLLTEIPIIVTKHDRRKKNLKRMAMVTGMVSTVILAVFLFDHFIMDLAVFKAKFGRKFL
ncbi:hypothetical protein [uncultured Desulfobacter sp.]|uniref:GumC family protein n=1 Tax=uncultured Desulfobacter sp. TaxID=240139 RepID=UPI002AA74643|nr:hypothetical protein [uncultured Desulfobacter sp.]